MEHEEALAKIVAELKKFGEIIKNQNDRLAKLERTVYSAWTPDAQPHALAEQPAPHTSTDASPLKTAPQAAPDRSTARGELEAKIGGNYLNKIGIIAVILSLVFFLKYSFDNNWIGPVGRVAIGMIAGFVLLSVGEYFMKKYPAWAKAFTGGGLAMLYFSLFAARYFYDLLTPLSALVFMSAVTLLGGVFAVRYNSRLVALFSIIGGFLAPLLVNSPDPNPAGLMSYLLILNLGILGLAHFKDWKTLNTAGFILTTLYGLASYDAMKLGTATLFLIVFFVLYSLIAIVYNLVQKQHTKDTDVFLIVANGAYFFGTLYTLLEPRFDAYLGLIALAVACFYILQATYALSHNRDDKYLPLTLTGLSISFVTVALALQLNQHWITIGWAVEALAISWIGLRLKNSKILTFSFVILLLAQIRLLALHTFDPSWGAGGFVPIFNQRVFASLVVIGATYGFGYFASRLRASLDSQERALGTFALIAAQILSVLLISVEVWDSFSPLRTVGDRGNQLTPYGVRSGMAQTRQVMLSVAWGLYAVAVLIMGILKRVSSLRWTGLALFGLTILKVMFADLSGLDTLYRIVAFVILGLMLIFASYLYQRFKPRIRELTEERGAAHETPSPAATPLNEILDQLDTSGYSSVTFSPKVGAPYSTDYLPLIKICVFVTQRFGKTEFSPGELAALYDEFTRAYRPHLAGASLALVKDRLAEFVRVGGSFTLT